MKFNRLNLLGVLSVIFTIAVMVFTSGCSDDDDPVSPFERDSNFVYLLDDTVGMGDSLHLEANVAYLCTGFVYIESTAVLSIAPGAVIKFATGSGANASALVIARGGKIYARGTAANPIIMTAKADSVGDPTDLATFAKGLWGGLIVLGCAPTNNTAQKHVEGIPDEPRTFYGGTDPHDNSGIIQYVSIRHGGSDIGAGNEINGLTLGAVGDGTTIDHIEVYSNQDDGVEFFGGTVETKYMCVAYCGDDSYDYDEGFNGKGQYWFTIQMSTNGGYAGEHDGAIGTEQSTPYAIPVISNATYIGSGISSTNIDNEYTIMLRDNAGGEYYNSIFYDFPQAGLTIEDLTDDPNLQDSRKRLEAGDIIFEHNVWYGYGDGDSATAIWPDDYTRTYMADANNDNVIADPELGGVTRQADNSFDPRPSAAGPAGSGATQPSSSFFDAVTYKGAFDPNVTPWIAGWTALEEYGFLQ